MIEVAANMVKLRNIEGKKIYVENGKRYMEVFGRKFLWDADREIYVLA